MDSLTRISNLNEKTALEFYKYQADLTVDAALRSPTLNDLMKIRERDVLTGLKMLIKALESSMNVKEKLREDQIFEIVIEFTREFRALTVDEIIYCFRKAKLGYYGKDYNRLDIITIALWLREYQFSSERHSKLREIEAEQRRNEPHGSPPPEFAKAVSDHIERVAKEMRERAAGVKGFSQSQFHQTLPDALKECSEDELESLAMHAHEAHDAVAAAIIQQEIFSRGV